MFIYSNIIDQIIIGVTDAIMCKLMTTLNAMHYIFAILALPCLGPLAPRGAVGARHDGLPRQFSPLLPVVCHVLRLSEGFAGPLRDVAIQLLFGLPLLRSPSTVPCSITLVMPSDLVRCPYHFSCRRFTVARRSPYAVRAYICHHGSLMSVNTRITAAQC